jgi:hypothetical protein
MKKFLTILYIKGAIMSILNKFSKVRLTLLTIAYTIVEHEKEDKMRVECGFNYQ